ncbi:MAG: Lpp/OprI family alanine-zipper lipoprotein [Candidatus Competibacteraceae bacterium]|jgi:hypothetical protein|nr:Lpp/OprI family alanine-zipper lipoprotein [Candidatus Competibacteraceae bacterium]
MIFKPFMKISALALVAGLSVGCATTGDLEKVRAEALQAQATANDAKSASETALATANEARSMASESLSCCRANEERLNRVFKRSMYK